MGKWRTSILKARITSDETESTAGTAAAQENILLFEIQVQLFGNETKDDKDNSYSSEFKEGWFIYRSMKQFETLHDNLNDISPSNINMLFKKLPSLKKHLTGRLSLSQCLYRLTKQFPNLQLEGKHIDEEKVKQATFILDDYLKLVSKDESLSQSDALYTFLCPSPDFYKRKLEKSTSNSASADEKFSISSIFKRFQ